MTGNSTDGYFSVPTRQNSVPKTTAGVNDRSEQKKSINHKKSHTKTDTFLLALKLLTKRRRNEGCNFIKSYFD